MASSKDSLPFDRSIHFLTLLSFPFFVYLEKKTLIQSRSERYRTVYGNENHRYEHTLHFHGLFQTFYVFQLIFLQLFSFRFFVFLKKKALTYVRCGYYSDTRIVYEYENPRREHILLFHSPSLTLIDSVIFDGPMNFIRTLPMSVLRSLLEENLNIRSNRVVHENENPRHGDVGWAGYPF